MLAARGSAGAAPRLALQWVAIALRGKEAGLSVRDLDEHALLGARVPPEGGCPVWGSRWQLLAELSAAPLLNLGIPSVLPGTTCSLSLILTQSPTLVPGRAAAVPMTCALPRDGSEEGLSRATAR